MIKLHFLRKKWIWTELYVSGCQQWLFLYKNSLDLEAIKKCKDVRSFPSPKRASLFVIDGKRILNTHFEEVITIGFGILTTPGNHICEILTSHVYCPEWQGHLILHANSDWLVVASWRIVEKYRQAASVPSREEGCDRLVMSALGIRMISSSTCTQYLPKWR